MLRSGCSSLPNSNSFVDHENGRVRLGLFDMGAKSNAFERG